MCPDPSDISQFPLKPVSNRIPVSHIPPFVSSPEAQEVARYGNPSRTNILFPSKGREWLATSHCRDAYTMSKRVANMAVVLPVL